MGSRTLPQYIGLSSSSISLGSAVSRPVFSSHELRFGIQSHGSRGIRTADALFTDLQPVLARKLLGADQAQGRAGFAGAAVHDVAFMVAHL